MKHLTQHINIIIVGKTDSHILEMLTTSYSKKIEPSVLFVPDANRACRLINSGFSSNYLVFFKPPSMPTLAEDIALLRSNSGSLKDINIFVLRDENDSTSSVCIRDMGAFTVDGPNGLVSMIKRDCLFADEQSTSSSRMKQSDDIPASENSIVKEKGYLTPRQGDVLKLVNEGMSNKEIARALELTEGTVKVHCKAIFRALGVVNRTQAAVLLAKSNMKINYSI